MSERVISESFYEYLVKRAERVEELEPTIKELQKTRLQDGKHALEIADLNEELKKTLKSYIKENSDLRLIIRDLRNQIGRNID